MTIQSINIGSAPNDGSGDPLRTAFGKTNDNFSNLTTDINTVSSNVSTLSTAVTAIQSNVTVLQNRAFGCFHKTANVQAGAANTVYPFDWYANTTAHVATEGVTVNADSPSNVIISTTGSYTVSLEMQVRSSVNAIREAYLWLAVNNVNKSESTIKAEIKSGGGGADAHQVINKLWLLEDIQANDAVEIRFAVNDPSGINLEYIPAQTTPYIRPAVPSATLTILPVGL